ncbi:hypothetical protein [Rhizomicrobium electricum]|jgi:hypothetical protein|uniref:Phage holin family protein n=1 Tax=Rhizomicrobium electricum TaxID=480070 RepID=A0ABP3PST7_9PROT|nr:hypothetical protein [Rhizomicrobium electricum]NIJ49701.1 hypothetical protein [Rhizomicrobium electricum]
MKASFIRIAIMAAVALVAAVFLIATGAFLCVALYEGLKLVVPVPALAALATAAILMFLSGIVLAIGSAIARAAERKARLEAQKKGPATAKIGLELGRILGESAAGYIGKNPVQVLIGALAVGFAVGAVPKLRSFLMGFMKAK